jgi:imidazolonepropionase
MKMSLPEVICAYTVGAAFALKLERKKGSLEVGKDADFVSTKLSWQDLFYSAGLPEASQVYLKGKRIFKSKN